MDGHARVHDSDDNKQESFYDNQKSEDDRPGWAHVTVGKEDDDDRKNPKKSRDVWLKRSK